MTSPKKRRPDGGYYRTIQSEGACKTITIPKEFVEALGIEAGGELLVYLRGGKVVIDG